MWIKAIVDEDFTNYKLPAMMIGSITCGGKCCIEAGLPMSICQNDGWRNRAAVEISAAELCERYLKNPITKAVVWGGLEPFEQFEDVLWFVQTLRFNYQCDDDIVIYTGYYPDEIKYQIVQLQEYSNIVVKFGRFVPNRPHHMDEILGVELAYIIRDHPKLCVNLQCGVE